MVMPLCEKESVNLDDWLDMEPQRRVRSNTENAGTLSAKRKLSHVMVSARFSSTILDKI